MDYTYLNYFNYYLKEYINDLINTFPETQQPLLANYRLLLEGCDDKNDLYVKCFYTKINNFLTQIAKRDTTLFNTQGKCFIEGVDLYNIWNNTNATDQTRVAIWKYLQILMILGRKIIPNHKEIIDMLQKVSNGDVNIPSKVEKTLVSDADIDDEDKDAPGVFGLGNIASSLSSLGNLASGLGLGKLVESFGANAGGGPGGGPGVLGDLVSGITDLFKNSDFMNAMSNLSETCNTQTNTTDTTDIPTTTNNTDNTDNNDNTNATHDNTTHDNTTTNDNINYSTDTMNNTTTTTNNNLQNVNNLHDLNDLDNTQKAPSNTDTTNKEANGNKTAPQLPPLFNNPVFSELAKELTDTFNFEEMEKNGKPKNISEAMGKFMTGDNSAKLMNLVGKFGSKLQKEVSNGSLNPVDLLKKTMSAMGGGGDNMQQTMANLMRSMPQMPQMPNMPNMPQGTQHKPQTSRERMRAKLDKKNNT